MDEHVDREDEHEDQPEACGDQRLQQAGAEGHDLVGAADDLAAQRLQRALALLLDLDVDALAVEVVLHVGEPVVGRVHDRRDVLLERGDLVGDGARQQEAREAEHGDEAEVHRGDRHAAGQVRAVQQADQRGEDQRDHRGRDEEQHDGPRRAHHDVEPQHEQRQRDELHPARDDRRGRRARGRLRVQRVVTLEVVVALRRRGLRGRQVLVVFGLAHRSSARPGFVARRHAREYAPWPTPPLPSCSWATWSAASAAGPCSACSRGCASSTGRRSSSSTPRTPRAGSASRRRSPTSCSPPASTSSRSATTHSIVARCTPTSTATTTSCAPRTTCPRSQGTA